MQHEMRSGTDVAAHALYDPASHVVAPSPDDLERFTEEVAEKGDALVIRTGGDGELGYRLYVDTPLPEELRARAQLKESELLLRAPSGHLIGGGLEDLWDKKGAQSAADVPPGDYLVDAWVTDFDWDQEIEPVLERELGPEYRQENRVGLFVGVCVVAALATLVGGIASWTLWLFLVGVGVAALGASVAALALPKGDYYERREEIVARFPPLVLVMRRTNGDVSQRHGGILYLD